MVEMVWRGRKLAEYAACLLYWKIHDRILSIYKNSPTASFCFILEFNNFAKKYDTVKKNL